MWNTICEVQLDRVFQATPSFTKRMDKEYVINGSSYAAVGAMPKLISYSTAQDGVDAFTSGTAKELAPDIRVTAVRHWYILTP